MKKLLFLLLLSQNVLATNYFIKSNGGTGTGLSDAAAWNLAHLNTRSFFPGDSIFFKRDNVFYGSFVLNSSGSSGNNIYIGAYGTGALPIITPIRSFPKWNNTANWRVAVGLTNVWVLELDTLLDYTPRIWLNGTEYKRARDTMFIDANRRTCFINGGIQAPTKQLVYVYATSNPATFYTSMTTASTVKSQFDIQGRDYLFIENLDIRGSQGATVEMFQNDYVTINNCRIGQDGNRQGVRMDSCRNITIANTLFDTGERNKQDFNFSYEGGDGINISGGTRDVEVAYNSFVDWRHAGVVVEQYGQAERDSLLNIYVHHNNFTSRDIDYGRGVAAYFNEGRNVRFWYNTISNTQVRNQFAAKGVSFNYNLIDTVNNLTYNTQEIASGFGIWLGDDFFKAEGMEFKGNTIKNCRSGGITLTGELDNNGSYPQVKNNVFDANVFDHNGYDVQNPEWVIGFPSDPRFTPGNTDILIRDNLDIENNTYTNNIFIRSVTDTPIYYGQDASNSYLKTVSSFNLLNGNNGNVITNNGILQNYKFKRNVKIINDAL